MGWQSWRFEGQTLVSPHILVYDAVPGEPWGRVFFCRQFHHPRHGRAKARSASPPLDDRPSTSLGRSPGLALLAKSDKTPDFAEVTCVTSAQPWRQPFRAGP